MKIRNLQDLEVFVAAAKGGGLSAAARALNLSPAVTSAALKRLVDKGRLSDEDASAVLARITPAASVEELPECGLVIEAVPEDLDLKRRIFADLADVQPSTTVLATNTSSIDIDDIAAEVADPERVLGLHIFNPPPVMRLVEVVPTVETADDVVATVLEVCASTGKHPVLCGDRAGFIVNALLFPYLNDAVKMLETHYATIDDIDFAMTSGCGHPMGPFALMDVVGLDVTLAIQRTLFDEFREPGDVPAPMLEHLVRAGYLGRKTSRGFRDYRR